MEDQRSDAGDLSDSAVEQAAVGQPAAESTAGEQTPDEQKPETKAAGGARRHRLPRGKLRRPVTSVPTEEPAAEETISAEPASTPAVELGESAVVAPGVEPGIDETDDTQTDVGEPEGEEPEPADAVESRQVVFVERRSPGRRAPIAIGVAAALFVGVTAFAGAALYPYLVDRASTATKFEIASTAANAITTLWTYTPDNMEQLADRSSKFLGGDFRIEYSKYIDAIVPTNKQAQVTNSTEVVGAAVESLNGPEATAMVYTNSTATSPLTKNIPSMRYLSYRLTLHRTGPEWLVTGMTAITSLDLTPHI